jgi:hypothetical protein
MLMSSQWCLCVLSVCPPFKLLKQLADFRKAGMELIRGQVNSVFLDHVQFEITTWRTYELMRW